MSPLLTFNTPGIVRLDMLSPRSHETVFASIRALHANPMLADTRGLILVLPQEFTPDLGVDKMRRLALYLVESQRRMRWARCALVASEPRLFALAQVLQHLIPVTAFEVHSFHGDEAATLWVQELTLARAPARDGERREASSA